MEIRRTPSTEKEVLIAGIPRCGTTYVFRSVAGLRPGGTTPKGGPLSKLAFLKTHGLAPPDQFGDPHVRTTIRHFKNGGRSIFIFGNPFLAAISNRHNRWGKLHAKNCGFKGPLGSANIYKRDDFNYERMFDSWTRGDFMAPVLVVRYETLPEHFKDIEYFLGRTVRWNEWKPRKTRRHMVSDRDFEAIKKTYGRLKRKMDDFPDIAIFNGQKRKTGGL